MPARFSLFRFHKGNCCIALEEGFPILPGFRVASALRAVCMLALGKAEAIKECCRAQQWMVLMHGNCLFAAGMIEYWLKERRACVTHLRFTGRTTITGCLPFLVMAALAFVERRVTGV